MYQKSKSYDVRFLKYGVRTFAIPDNLENQNSEKLKKTTWRYHFTSAHHKWKSYDVWFLRYGAWLTKFFVIMDYFLPFYSPLPNNPENQNFQKIKNEPEVSFYTSLLSMTIIWCMVSQVWSMRDILGYFFPFYLSNIPKNQNFEKME